jgi:hypothetical protein
MTAAETEMNCQELVEVVTEYLEGALHLAEAARLERHILKCGKCLTYLDQMRQTIRLTGMLTEQDLTPEARDSLLAVFRNWKRDSRPTG